jgi:hypothetical protein
LLAVASADLGFIVDALEAVADLVARHRDSRLADG